MNVYAALIITVFLYAPFVFAFIKNKNRLLGIKILIGILLALVTATYCYNEPSIWSLYKRTWYWAITAGFTFSALPYAGLIMLLQQLRESDS